MIRDVVLRFLLLPSLLFVTACTESLSTKDDFNDSWADAIALQKATDVNAQSNIVEVNLEAIETEIELKPGVFTTMWTYNGIFPGPTIEAKVGDTLVVNFTNKLNVNTTIHWHGLELPANMDGSFTAQLPVEPGGTFRYEFTLNRAATHWYHPHIQSNIQIEKGLYGALIVRDYEEDQKFALPETETTIILDDILLNDAGQIEPAMEEKINVDPIENALTQLNGRVGNGFLINGKLLPNDTLGDDIQTIKVRSGHPVRLRLINAANATFFRLSIPNHILYKIGGDSGLISTPIPAEPIDIIFNETQQSLSTGSRNKIRPRDGGPQQFYSNPDLAKGIMIVPGERADVIFTPIGEAGQTENIEWHFFPRGLHGVEDDGTGNLVINHNHTPALAAPVRILKFEFIEHEEPTHVSYSPPVTLKATTPIVTDENTPILPIVFGHSNPDVNGDINFFASKDKLPFTQLDDSTALNAKIGETYIWEVTNLSQGDHPFHPHGFTFQHISTEYIDQNAEVTSVMEYPALVETKDTIRIPGRRGLKGQSRTIVKLAVQFDETNRVGQIEAIGKTPTSNPDGTVSPGGWFVHCHILEHANRGMGTYLNLTY